MNYVENIAGQIRTLISDGNLPAGDTEALLRSYAVLALVKGVDTTNRDVHNAWVAWMTAVDPDHKSLVPFEQLDQQTQQEDSPFTTAIKTVAARL